MAKKIDQKTLKRWYDKGFPWTYKRDCAVCGAEFYTQSAIQMVCDKEKCRTKWEERSSTHE